MAERELKAGAAGKTRVLAHTIFWQYIPRETKDAIRSAVEKAAQHARGGVGRGAAPAAALQI